MRKCKNDFVKHLDFLFELIPWVIVTELTTEFETVLSVVSTSICCNFKYATLTNTGGKCFQGLHG
jgi:hypothetical protein